MLACTQLTLSVPGRVLCRSLSARFAPGEIWAVLGRNGTGKSTLMHALAGLAAPEEGSVELDGAAVGTQDPRRRARTLGVLLQLEPGAYWGRVEDYVLLGRYPHANSLIGYTRAVLEEARGALDAVSMADFARRRFDTLSGGERQRVRIAQLLAQRPRVYLLDEPLQHLDVAHQGHVLRVISERVRRHGETAVMVLHEPFWIGRACTHALVLEGDGAVSCGPADEVLTLERLERAYGCALREVRHAQGRSFVPDV
jgi:iron complex transport system ATP-binding protein